MYKMIVLDLDGTLLNDYKKISLENAEAIKRAYSEKGVISVIATGRPLEYVNELWSLYGNCFASYIIACNGAIIKNIENNEYIHKVPFTNEKVLNIRGKFFENEDTEFMMLYTDKNTISEAKNHQILEDAGININKSKVETENIEDAIKKNPDSINLLCLIGGNVFTLENIIKNLNTLDIKIEKPVICSYLYKNGNHTFESRYIDIVKSGCSKKNAIHILADKLGIKQDEIIVMGDGGNDISMFECAGLKIAMENAEEYLKEKADFVTASNNDNGVAKAIQKFIFDEN